MTSLLQFEGVTCRRGGRLLFEALDVDVGPGDALQLTGPNGSGKSSLIRLAAGLLRPERGTIEAAPAALADDHLALDRERPLGAALQLWGGDVEAGLAAVEMQDLSDVPVRLLSTGQRKRATLARVVAAGASLWLLDEPANGLDYRAGDLLSKLIEAHRHSGGAVLAASHTALSGDWRTLELGR